jgi:hypothetical protein
MKLIICAARSTNLGHSGAPPLGGEPAPRNDAGYDSHFKNALLVQLYTELVQLYTDSVLLFSFL